MSKYNIKLLTFISMIMVFQVSCRYEDGPGISFRTAKNRLVNIWQIEKVYDNGTEVTNDFKSTFPNWTLEMTKDMDYTLSYSTFVGTYKETGDWELLENGTKLNLRKDGTGTNVWKIKRLTSSELWATQQQSNGNTVEYRLK